MIRSCRVGEGSYKLWSESHLIPSIHQFMKNRFCRALLIVLSCLSITGADARSWTSQAGTNIEAKLVKRLDDKVALLTDKGRKLTVKISDLSKNDQQFLAELLIEEVGSKIEGIDAEPGKLSPSIKCEGSKWTYHVYLPKKFHMGRKWPVCFIMSAGGGVGGNMMRRYIKGAESSGCILVGSVESKNKFEESQAAMESMADDVYERFPVERKFAIASGMSGGSRASFLLAETNKDVVGVLACGSGGGVYPDNEEFRESDLRKKTYVYSLIGTNCFNRTGSYKTHKSLSDECRLRFFPGNHDWANERLLEQGMLHVFGGVILANKSLEPYKKHYLSALKVVTDRLKEEEPWESYYLAKLGSQIDERYEKGYFDKMATKLASNPKVELALKAEKDIEKLCSMFYLKFTYHSGDRDDISKRTEKGAELAKPYAEIPHGELLKRLGQKCK